jgi:hypothetical protein
MVQKEVLVGKKAKNYETKLAMTPYQDTWNHCDQNQVHSQKWNHKPRNSQRNWTELLSKDSSWFKNKWVVIIYTSYMLQWNLLQKNNGVMNQEILKGIDQNSFQKTGVGIRTSGL